MGRGPNGGRLPKSLNANISASKQATILCSISKITYSGTPDQSMPLPILSGFHIFKMAAKIAKNPYRLDNSAVLYI